MDFLFSEKLFFGLVASIFFTGMLGVGAVFGEEPWVVYQPPADESFSVSTPVKLEKLEKRDEWRAVDAQGRTYSAGFGYYTKPQKITEPESFMRMMVNRLAANTHSKIAYCWFFKYQYVPACEFKLVDAGDHQTAAGRYFLVHQWFYFLDYAAADQTFDVRPMKKFFESFRIVNPALKDFLPDSSGGDVINGY